MTKELIYASLVYLLTIFTIVITLYSFLDFTLFNFSIISIVSLLGWSYMIGTILSRPKREIEQNLLSLTQNIIHELNIPIATINANTSMLKKSTTDDKSLKRIQRIEDASIRLQKLYDELIYGINKEIRVVPKETFDIENLIRDRVEIFEEQNRNMFKLTLYNYNIKADKIGLEQALDNIISNAMKYSSKESIISISLDKNILTITDKGIGISDTELLRIYERYYQADNQKYGDGIGLALVKSYCDEADIDIRIESIKDVGTSVYLDFRKLMIK